MKILQVNKLYPPAVGGIEKTVGQLARGLNATNQVSVLAIREGFGFGSVCNENGVKVMRCGGFGRIARMPVSLSFFWYFWRESKKADITHVHYPFPLVSVALWLFRPKAPVFITWHSSVVRQKFLGRLVKPFVDWTLKHASGIITTFPAASSFYAELGRYENKTEAIPLAFDGSVVSSRVEAEKNSLIFIHVGRLVYYKGLPTVMRAFAGVPEGELWIVGSGPLLDELKELAKNLHIEQRVRFISNASDQHVCELMAQADVFVLGSDHVSEVFGMVQLEAMAAGLPVINTQLPTGVPWVARDNVEALTVQPSNVEEMSIAMKKMTSSSGLRQRFSDAARIRASQFSSDRMIEAHRKFYQSALEKRRSLG